METAIDKNAGFCAGVTNAIKIAEEYLKTHDSLYCLGELVHNETVMATLIERGLKIISIDDLKTIHSSTVLLRAHGEPKSTYRIAKDNNNTIIDATCPIVTKLQQNVINSHLRGENIYIFGQREHPEVAGIIGNIDGRAVVFGSLYEIRHLKEGDKITLYSQTTMPPYEYQEIIDELKNRKVDIIAANSICNSVKNRLDALKEFCKEHSVIIFVTGSNSSNGKSLFTICKEINSRSHLISSAEEIDKRWFDACKSIGISGATSTPVSLLNAVAEHIHHIL
ncbi:MAG: 4-hydroxy-3-methylbut-2-enyl diphosphate reductase [Bacteroidales bacterium]|nr:4-hydroxy-3-methylbut-2-enyl diphosphate reductase [Bacteroidales bacterium]